MATPSRTATVRRLEQASGALATSVTAHLDERLEWFRDLPADERSWVGLIAQAGIAGVIAWYPAFFSARIWSANRDVGVVIDAVHLLPFFVLGWIWW